MADSSDLLPSLIRTWVPVMVGGLLSWLATQNLKVSGGVQDALATLLTSAVIALYYTLVRILEQRWPAFGLLLGTANQPSYAASGAPAPPAAPVPVPEPPGPPTAP